MCGTNGALDALRYFDVWMQLMLSCDIYTHSWNEIYGDFFSVSLLVSDCYIAHPNTVYLAN